ncbi:hypothetical protein V6R21_27645 [Limibacter armeniacum]|uniref:hypothetical protein n=1 Tax=Limibacter armeniacum TaxID=466084 RepID=UPI002FE63798
MIKKTFTLIALSFLTVMSCKNNSEELLFPDCSTENITYTEHIEPILSTCVGCHNGPLGNDGIDLSTEAKVLEAANDKSKGAEGRLLGAIKGLSGYAKMPPGSGATPLSECEIKQIEAWVNANLED